MKSLVIGDIHGCYAELMALLDKVGLSTEDQIIALGDILDRGPDPEKVMDFFSQHPQASCLMGNHEHKHLLVNQGTIKPSISQKITRKQFSSQGYARLIQGIRQFPSSIEHETAIMVHGAVEPGIALAEQKQSVLLGTRNGEAYLKQTYDKPWYELYHRKKPIIAGHRDISGKGEIRIINDTVFFLDTGCCYGRRLSAILLPDFKTFQVNSRKNYWGIIKQQANQAKRRSPLEK